MERKDEILAVKELGDKIGYGNMMQLASALWGVKLKEEHGFTSGQFVPTIPELVAEQERPRVLRESAEGMRHVRRHLGMESVKHNITVIYYENEFYDPTAFYVYDANVESLRLRFKEHTICQIKCITIETETDGATTAKTLFTDSDLQDFLDKWQIDHSISQ